ncbi:MAG TPA: hypothetical protein VLF64_01880 [Candidatus Saccharimonadales bacterium]|nr:hypothetical protein [Candidatus Saccharimonadales bacterium]
MAEQRTDVAKTVLTPVQSADVIRYYDTAANRFAYDNGWKPKIALGRVAVNTTQPRHSIIPNEEKPERAFTEPALTPQEMSEGLEHLMKGVEPEPSRQSTGEWPIDPTDEQWKRIEKLKETHDPITAYEMVMGIWAH